MLTVNELFAGIGSQSAALERLGVDFKVVGIAEIDKYAIKSYEAIHGPVRNYGDISKIEKLDYADFWTYSFPCQDISVAGKQRGINENTRSGLLYEVERLLYKSIMYGEQPKWLMLENVKNLVGKQFKPQFEAWIKRLDELGYNTYWKVLNAKNYGIPQNRERVFAISIRKDIDTGYEFPVGFDNGKRLKDILESEVDEKYYLSNKMIKYVSSSGTGGFYYKPEFNSEIAKPITASVAKMQRAGCANYITEKNNETEPKIIRIGNTNPSGHGMNGDVFHQDGLSPTLTTNKGEGPKIVEPRNEINQIGMLDIKGNEQIRRVYADDGVSPTLNTMQGGNRQPKILELCIAASRGRNPENPSDRTVGSPTEQRLEVNKNGTSNTITTVQKDNYVLEPNTIIDDTQGFDGTRYYSENSPTLRSQRSGLKTIDTQFRIRKLTPLECWRLMGFADDQFYKAEKVNSNSQLYKQAGNSICVDVLYYLFKNLFIKSEV